jgi:hypothetical protein
MEYPREFEAIAKVAAEGYFAGEGVHIGAPGRLVPKPCSSRRTTLRTFNAVELMVDGGFTGAPLGAPIF